MTTWNKIGRILAIVVIVLSILSILAGVVGIVGVWSVNGPMTDGLVELASLAQNGLEAAQRALDRVDPLLTDLRAAMREVQNGAEELKAGIKDSDPIIQLLSALVGEDITPRVEEAAESLATIRQAARDLNAAALAINNVPFVNIAGISEATQNFVDLFDSIENEIAELDANVETLKSGVVEGAVQPVYDLAAEVESGLAEFLGETRDLASRVDNAYDTTTKVKSRIPLIIDLISLALTLVLLWGILAQAALIYLSWLYRRTNRLDMHHVLAQPDSTGRDAPESDMAPEPSPEALEDVPQEVEST